MRLSLSEGEVTGSLHVHAPRLWQLLGSPPLLLPQSQRHSCSRSARRHCSGGLGRRVTAPRARLGTGGLRGSSRACARARWGETRTGQHRFQLHTQRLPGLGWVPRSDLGKTWNRESALLVLLSRDIPQGGKAVVSGVAGSLPRAWRVSTGGATARQEATPGLCCSWVVTFPPTSLQHTKPPRGPSGPASLSGPAPHTPGRGLRTHVPRGWPRTSKRQHQNLGLPGPVRPDWSLTAAQSGPRASQPSRAACEGQCPRHISPTQWVPGRPW